MITLPPRDREQLIIADLDLSMIDRECMSLDVTGHYARPDVFSFSHRAIKHGAIDVLHKQLTAVAIALTTQCPYCIELHVKAARQAGANDRMLTEAAIVAAAMRAGAAITHATHRWTAIHLEDSTW